MKEFCLLLIFSGSLLLSCGRSNQREDSLPDIAQYYIDIEKSISNIKSIPLSLVGQEIEFIPLETNPNCLLKNIRQIALSDSFIFVCGINKLLQFDRYGSVATPFSLQSKVGHFSFLALKSLHARTQTHTFFLNLRLSR